MQIHWNFPNLRPSPPPKKKFFPVSKRNRKEGRIFFQHLDNALISLREDKMLLGCVFYVFIPRPMSSFSHRKSSKVKSKTSSSYSSSPSIFFFFPFFLIYFLNKIKNWVYSFFFYFDFGNEREFRNK